jgi:hypothetical protein
MIFLGIRRKCGILTFFDGGGEARASPFYFMWGGLGGESLPFLFYVGGERREPPLFILWRGRKGGENLHFLFYGVGGREERTSTFYFMEGIGFVVGFCW